MAGPLSVRSWRSDWLPHWAALRNRGYGCRAPMTWCRGRNGGGGICHRSTRGESRKRLSRTTLPPRVPMEAVDSKGIRWIRYDERTRTLDVAYTNSGEYRYFDVGPEVYAWLVRAESKGKFVNRLVKEKYRYERLG